MPTQLSVVFISAGLFLTSSASAFVAPRRGPPPTAPARGREHRRRAAAVAPRPMSGRPPPGGDGEERGAGGEDLASEFFRTVRDRDISFEGDEINFADAEEEEMESPGDSGEIEEPEDGDDAILREYDVPPSAEGSQGVTDEQIYAEARDRMFESAGAFVELNSDGGTGLAAVAAGEYEPPESVPDAGLTAGEVVELVLAAFRNNDTPTPDYGVGVFIQYCSPGSQVAEQVAEDGLTVAQYRRFLLAAEENLPLFEHVSARIDRADYSPDRLRGYFTARLVAGSPSATDDVSVNFILSTTGTDDSDCWMIDSMLIRPPKLRRRRRTFLRGPYK